MSALETKASRRDPQTLTDEGLVANAKVVPAWRVEVPQRDHLD